MVCIPKKAQEFQPYHNRVNNDKEEALSTKFVEHFESDLPDIYLKWQSEGEWFEKDESAPKCINNRVARQIKLQKTGKIQDSRGYYFGETYQGKREGWGAMYLKPNSDDSDSESDQDHLGQILEYWWHNNEPIEGRIIIEWPNNDSSDGSDDDYSYYNGEEKGGVYVGKIYDYEPHGFGKFKYFNGESYKGKFKRGYYNGYGVYKQENGDVFKGEWKDGDEHGEGECIYADGNSFRGRYEFGQRVGKHIHTEAFSGETSAINYSRDKRRRRDNYRY
ncbi:hypothetical protein FGO68_gene16636 [Halteria grandinella]|uniref:MORN repeat protein n=1 Tax=Halteria grandinella TaxID=5974 RepID=A0A8J8NX16_HALGN|nr:hypothetical protein FGO68_gene16636 [Halteria grandinella]